METMKKFSRENPLSEHLQNHWRLIRAFYKFKHEDKNSMNGYFITMLSCSGLYIFLPAAVPFVIPFTDVADFSGATRPFFGPLFVIMS